MSLHCRRRVCLFGTSANPPTGSGGHSGIVVALASLRLPPTPDGANIAAKDGMANNPPLQLAFDEVRVLPVYQHMFSSKRRQQQLSCDPSTGQPTYDDRLEMCRLAFGHIASGEEGDGDGDGDGCGSAKVTISDAERICFESAASARVVQDCEMTAPTDMRVGTADLLDMLMEREPETDFSFALGADTFMDLTDYKWKRSRDVTDLLHSRLMVIYRTMPSSTSFSRSHDSKRELSREDLLERINMINERQRAKDAASSVTPTQPQADPHSFARLLELSTLDATSSSEARSTLDETALRRLVAPGVLEYIKANRLYQFAD